MAGCRCRTQLADHGRGAKASRASTQAQNRGPSRTRSGLRKRTLPLKWKPCTLLVQACKLGGRTAKRCAMADLRVVAPGRFRMVNLPMPYCKCIIALLPRKCKRLCTTQAAILVQPACLARPRRKRIKRAYGSTVEPLTRHHPCDILGSHQERPIARTLRLPSSSRHALVVPKEGTG